VFSLYESLELMRCIGWMSLQFSFVEASMDFKTITVIAVSSQSTEQQVHGVLNLVDLAGSERLSRSGATGERLKETQVPSNSFFVVCAFKK
jgi:hypothetical protein